MSRPGVVERALPMLATSHLVDPQVVAAALDVDVGDVVTALFPLVATEVHEQRPWWVLRPNLRRRWLADFAPAPGVTLPPPASATTSASEALLRQWLTGALTDVPQKVHTMPDPLRQVAGWLQDCARLRPPARAVLQRLAVAELRAKYQRTATAAFVGRRDELHRLGELLDAAPWLAMIEAPGGMGKSALLARFLLERGAFRDGGPLALVIDFDDPGLTPARPDLIYAEMARQAAIQDATFDSYEQELRANADAVEGAGTERAFTSEDDTSALDDHRTEALVRLMFEQLGRRGGVTYVALDTLERPRQTIPALLEAFLGRLLRIVDDARHAGAAIAVIVAGRGPLASPALAATGARPIPLGPLKRKFGAKLLAELGVPRQFVAAVLDSFEASPLTLRLAAQALAAGATEIVDVDAAIGAVRRARGAGYLQLRILDHLPSARLADVARRALLLTTITPERLVTIVGPLVAPPIDGAEAELLFDQLARISEVVTFAGAGERCLVLRAEVADDIAELSAVADPALVVAVRTRAVEVLAGSAALRDRDDVAAHRTWLATLTGGGRHTSGRPPAAGPALTEVRIQFDTLVSGHRHADALALIHASEAAHADLGLLLGAAKVARRAASPTDALHFAELARVVAARPIDRAQVAVAEAWALGQGAAGGPRPDEVAARYDEARAAWHDGAATQGTIIERAEVLAALAEHDARWARTNLEELFAANGWAALADAERDLLRQVCSLVGSAASLEWAAKLGGFEGRALGPPHFAALATAMVDAELGRVGLGDDVGAIEARLSELAKRGELGRAVVQIVYAVGVDGLTLTHPELDLRLDRAVSTEHVPAQRVLVELADLLDQFRGVRRDRVVVDVGARAGALRELTVNLTAKVTPDGWREFIDSLGDRSITRRATASDHHLAVTGSLAAIDRRRRGDDFAKLLDDRGLTTEATLARAAFGDGDRDGGDDDPR